MTTNDPMGFFRSRWELTAPESYALLYGAKHEHPTETFKLALIELIARGKLSLVEREKRGLLGRASVELLERGGDRERPSSRSLGALLELFEAPEARAHRGGRVGGVTVAGLVRAARKKYGWPGGYARAEVMPALEKRGLYELWSARLPFPLSGLVGPRWEPTASGRRAMGELEELISLGYRRFEGWADEDPEKALRFLALAGSAVLLMRPLHRDARRLLDTLEVADGAASLAPHETALEGEDAAQRVEEWLRGLSDVGRAAFDAPYPDLGSLDGLDGAFHAVDHGLGGHHGGGHHGGHHGGG